MGIKVGICGAAGGFSDSFIPLFQAHPDVDEVYLADLLAEPLAEQAAKHKIATTFPSLDEMLKSDCDCIAIFTQRWSHAPLAVQSLKAGKHVYSAVPAAATLEELDELVKTVEETGLIYMLGETSYYRAQTTFCREKFANGDFGKFVYGEGQYHHDMAHFYESYFRANGDNWKRFASYPPMLYPTHSTAFVLGVTFRRMTEVCCFGYVDDDPDGIFDAELSAWKNRFSNETALFKTSDGGSARVCEFRRTAHSMMDRMTITGTKGCYQEQPREEGILSNVWTWLDFPEGYGADGNIPYREAHDSVKFHKKDHNDLCVFGGVTITEENRRGLPDEYLGKTFLGISSAQSYEILPVEFAGLPNGHEGTHLFLVADFMRSMVQQKLAPNHVWLAARYNAPGIVAHQSAERDGELMKIPDYGVPSESWSVLEGTPVLQS